jgi:hypothetical protein
VALNTNKTDYHRITELLLTVALNTNKTDHHSITELLLTVVLNINKTDHHSITDPQKANMNVIVIYNFDVIHPVFILLSFLFV